jgi:3-deoxy-7-phosphoheptulonate synthase
MNINISNITPIKTPEEIMKLYPATHFIQQFIFDTRTLIEKILSGEKTRKIVVVGPCSIHDINSALEYAKKLNAIQKNYPNLLLVMRVYFEKPRTTTGWKGFINDPDLNNTNDINKGLILARKLLLHINAMGLAVGCEFLDTISPQYISDLVSWGAIGARTTESQVHRQLASGLSMPIGFKNGTSGSIDIAIDAVEAVKIPHHFLGINYQGQPCIVTTLGNIYTHVILRGGTIPNYSNSHINNTKNKMIQRGFIPNIMVDCSHGNSKKNYKNQMIVIDSICEHKNTNIIGLMIESHLFEGKQQLDDPKKLKYGVSITDSCVSFKETIVMLNKYNSLWNKN